MSRRRAPTPRSALSETPRGVGFGYGITFNRRAWELPCSKG